jgi:hypothetical protein
MQWIESKACAIYPVWRIVGALAAVALLSSVAGLAAANLSPALPAVQPPGSSAPNQITGTLLKIDGSTLTAKTRKGANVLIDDTAAVKAHKVTPLAVGKAFVFQGAYDPRGKMAATLILRAKPSTDSWPIDR